MNVEFIEAIEQISKDKNIEKQILIDAIEASLISAFKRNFGTSQNVSVNINQETGEVKVYAKKEIVENVNNDLTEISLEKALEINKTHIIGGTIDFEVTPKKFGRIAAQTAKQVVLQRIKEAEREIIYEDFLAKQNDVITGIIRRIEKKNVMIESGKTEVILAPKEQVPGERYDFNSRIKVYVLEVKKTTKGPQVYVSRTNSDLVKRLFEMEVPEIYDGTIEIKSISREPGSRTKISVYSSDPNLDPVGACVGQQGSRVQIIVNELKGEKIDIIKWDTDPVKYIAESLSPAKVVDVEINEEDKSAKVLVPDYQLSLAIGKEGQNVRLAAKLTGWRIDIKSE